MTHQQETFIIDDLLEELLIAVKENLQNAGKPEIEVEIYRYSEEHTCSILADRELLRQVLAHLLDNAVKFINRGFIVFGYHVMNENLVDFFVDDTRDDTAADLTAVNDLLQQMGSHLKKSTRGLTSALSFSIESEQIVLNQVQETKIA